MSYEPTNEQWIDVDGVRKRYLDIGAGEPVLFFHGGHMGDPSGAESADIWNLNMPELSQHFRCIGVDRLGQGFTDTPKMDDDYSMRGSINHAIGFMEELGAGPYHIVGHSRGGYVVAQITLQRPDLVKSCTLVSSNTAAPGPGRNEIVFATNPHPPFSRERAWYSFEKYSFSTAHVEPSWFEFRLKALTTDKYRHAAKRMMVDGLFETVFQPELRRSREEMFARLERESIGRPMMMFWGVNDPTASIAQGYELQRLIARHAFRCQMHVVNEAGHYSYREQPAAFNRVLRSFIEECRYGV